MCVFLPPLLSLALSLFLPLPLLPLCRHMLAWSRAPRACRDFQDDSAVVWVPPWVDLVSNFARLAMSSILSASSPQFSSSQNSVGRKAMRPEGRVGTRGF